MRFVTAIVMACSVIGAPLFGADATFPYPADVSVEEVEVRCGPDWEYYATQRLRRGAKVEVYRHEPGGWLAIRPPEGSFSLIPARHVKRDDGQRVGEVTIDGAVSWVGSAVTSVSQHKWQVRLERGEFVEILGEQSLSIGPGFATETYYKIAPPAGEFRWIHAEHALAPGAVAHRSSTRTIELTDVVTSGNGSGRAAHGDSATARISSAATTSASEQTKDLDELARQVEQLKVDLSLFVTQRIEQWDLDALRTRTEALAQATKGTILARQVRLVIYRINEFETLRARYQKMSERGETGEDPRVQRHGVSAAPRVQRTSWQEDLAAGLDEDQPAASDDVAPIGTGVAPMEADPVRPRFDAEGWLMPVHSTRRVAPPFALLDDEGRVLCYVTPAPGLNLRRYTKQHVGLFGQHQYVNDLRASLLTVSRVVKQKD